jgi:hypothetical protein
MLSYQIVAVTVGWHIYEVTRNPFSLGLVGLAEVLPFFCVAPFAGYLVDHLPRRRLGHGGLCRAGADGGGADLRRARAGCPSTRHVADLCGDGDDRYGPRVPVADLQRACSPGCWSATSSRAARGSARWCSRAAW